MDRQPKASRIYRNNKAFNEGQRIGSRLRNQDKMLGEE